MLVQIDKLPSLTSEIPFSNNNAAGPESRPDSAQGAPNPASQPPTAPGLPQGVPSSASQSPAMAAQYYAKRVEEPPKPTGMMLPALAAAIAPGQVQDTRYRSPYSAPEPPRPPHALAPIAPMAPMTMASGSNTPDPGAARSFPNLNEANRMLNRTSSESQTDEHHDPPQPLTMPGNNQYTAGVQRVSHPGTPQPTPGDGSKPPRPRPHVCLTCQRTFARREHLNRHELSHTKEKPFECNECSRCFSRRDLLLRHKQKLHLTNPYVRPRDRVKGDGPSDGDSPMAPMAQMSGNDGTTGVSIAIHPSGQVQRSHDGGPSGDPTGQLDGDRGGPSSMAMAHLRPALPIPRAPQHQQSQPPPQPQATGSAASLYYQKQDIDVSKIDLSRFRSLGRSSHSPHPTGPPPQQPGHYQGPYHPPPQGAPVPVSPHAQHRHVEVPRPPIEPINHEPEESGFHIPFAKRPRRDTDGRSRAAQQARHEQGQQLHLAEPRKPGAFPQYMPPPSQYEPPHSLLDQLAIAAVPGEQPRYRDRDEPIPQAPMGMSYAQPPHQPEHEVWRSPGGTHRVVQFDHSPHPSHAHPPQSPHPSAMDTSTTGLAPPSPNMQTRPPSQGRKRSLQDEDEEEEEGMKMQGGFRRSMRRALSMSMEDSQRPAALLKALEDAAAKETAEKKEEKRRRAKKSATPEGGRPNVRYVKPQTSKDNLKDKKTEKEEKVEKKASSPVRGRKPSAKAKTTKEESEEVTPEKRSRGRPPKATPSSSATSKKSAKASKQVEESEDEDNEGDEQAAIEEQLAQEEKRTRSAMKETKKANVKETKAKPRKKEEKEEDTPGRTFRSVRLQAKYIDKK